MTESDPLDDAELAEIRRLVDAATVGPWTSFVEGRDFLGGGSIIRTGGEQDIEFLGATAEDQDFIANARQAIPRLLDEIERLRKLTATPT